MLDKLTVPVGGKHGEKITSQKQLLAGLLGVSATDAKVVAAKRAEAAFCAGFLTERRQELVGEVESAAGAVETQPSTQP